MEAVDMLAAGGTVAAGLPQYEPRPQQIDMAAAVAAAFERGEHLMVEAGTGVGKSFAYLLPAIERAVGHGCRVVVSTHTIALQEQLIDKDIPFLQSVYPQEFSAVLVKGRSNYIGLRRLTRASQRQRRLFSDDKEMAELHRIEDWAYETDDGSLADMDREPARAVWDRVKSDADDCFGRRCPTYKKCFYQRARRRAQSAQLLIVNHALLFADLAVRRSGSSILPDYDYVVLDEAHTVERVAGDYFGVNLANLQIHYLLNSLRHERTGRGILKKKGTEAAVEAVREARQAVDGYFDHLTAWLATQPGHTGRLRKPPPVEETASPRLAAVYEALRKLREDADDENYRSEIGAAMERCTSLASDVRAWHEQAAEDWVYWIEVGEGWSRRISLSGRPIDVGPLLKKSLFDAVKSVVLTSATLTTTGREPFAYLQGRLGLEQVRSLQLGSPFDYRKQVTAFVVPGMPDPARATEFVAAACEAMKKYLARTQGHAFVLFTSYAMMKECAAIVSNYLEAEKMPLLVQGTGMPRSAMLGRFRAVPRSVLFGTDTFWEGVDIPGDALTNVIIVKLPFAVPNHPVVEARIERMRENGRQPFMEFQLPEAILKFKQGIGRLIRSRNDHGIIAILDPRVRTKPYGKHFLDALPGCEVVIEG